MCGNCPWCEEDISDEVSWENLMREDLLCPLCGGQIELDYDEIYYGEEGDYEEEQVWNIIKRYK